MEMYFAVSATGPPQSRKIEMKRELGRVREFQKQTVSPETRCRPSGSADEKAKSRSRSKVVTFCQTTPIRNRPTPSIYQPYEKRPITRFMRHCSLTSPYLVLLSRRCGV